MVESKIDFLLELVTKRLCPKLEPVRGINSSVQTANVLCWRGGMRSGFVARLIELAGFQSATLQGGYKSYRRWTLKRLDQPLATQNLCIIGGFTGTGKTEILHALKSLGEQVIDLEALACHKGSSFGGIGLAEQPSQEHFENTLAWEIDRLDWSRPVWIEDESRLIGRCHLPAGFYSQMLRAPVICLQKSKDSRLTHLVESYGTAPSQALSEATIRISKRLGSQLTKDILSLFEKGQTKEAFAHLLSYYDKAYAYQLNKREQIQYLGDDKLTTPSEWACALTHLYDARRNYNPLANYALPLPNQDSTRRR